MLPSLICFRNLDDDTGAPGFPWDFRPSAENLKQIRDLKKEARRLWTIKTDTVWNCYSAMRGVATNLRISGNNAPVAIRAFVADYDTISSIEAVQECLNQCSPELLPNFVEQSLGLKWRAVWLFERELLIPHEKFIGSFLEKLAKFLGASTLLAGFDPASFKPTQLWTNGGEWYPVSDTPLKTVFLHGVATKIIADNDTGSLEIPIEALADEAAKRYPGRWTGEFILGAHGVRFWDPKADNPRGAFITKAGCYCLTGIQPFVSWSEIFGYQWVEQQKTLNLGRAAGGIYFDNRTYWHEMAEGYFLQRTREDTLLHLARQGFSRKQGKAPLSEAERILSHIQDNNRIKGAVPIVYRPPGITVINGERYLNTSTLKAIAPADGPADISKHPWLWEYLTGFFARGELGPFKHFMAWLSRFYKSILFEKPLPGQALFICGPASNGKTLLVMKVIAALAGGRTTNPYDVLIKNTSFNADIFSAGVLAINDEEAPYTEKERDRFVQGIKSFCVNPEHQYHPKYHDKTTISWFGRLLVTLNDDAKSVGILPELNHNTQDKMMFFASQPYGKPWPDRYVIEDTLLREMPHFGRTLLELPEDPEVMDPGSRAGVKSYFDPHIVDLAKQQESSYNLVELLSQWFKLGGYWQDPKMMEWVGSPTELLTYLSESGSTNSPVLRNWTVDRVAKSLTALVHMKTQGVELLKNRGKERVYRIMKTTTDE